MQVSDPSANFKDDIRSEEYEKLIHNLEKIKSTVGGKLKKNENKTAFINLSYFTESGCYMDNFHTVFGNPNKSCCKSGSNKYLARSDSSIHQHLYETPHEEIQQLHQHFEDMLNEVVELKRVISELKNKKHDNVVHVNPRTKYGK